jgi:hypothetical protein
VRYAKEQCQQLTQKTANELPLELRNMVYREFLLLDGKSLKDRIPLLYERARRGLETLIAGFPCQMTRSDFFCYQFRREFAEYYYSHMQFALHVPSVALELLQTDFF